MARRKGSAAPVKFRPPKLYLLNRAALRRIDHLSAAAYGLPTMLLMENAAVQLAGEALAMLAGLRNRTTLIVCGPGNNGGDGLALARHLSNAAVPVGIVLATGPGAFSGDAAVHLRVARKLGLPIVRADGRRPGLTLERLARRVGTGPVPGLVVDAVFGTGLSRPVAGPIARLIQAMNCFGERGATVLAVDIPSGLDCDTGEVLGVAVRADVTVSFIGLKPGFLRPAVAPYVGEVVVADIGSPAVLTRQLGTPVRATKRR
jgi:hydroxyethylthiazole kinase-like uncharacterized protein yjeF